MSYPKSEKPFPFEVPYRARLCIESTQRQSTRWTPTKEGWDADGWQLRPDGLWTLTSLLSRVGDVWALLPRELIQNELAELYELILCGQNNEYE